MQKIIIDSNMPKGLESLQIGNESHLNSATMYGQLKQINQSQHDLNTIGLQLETLSRMANGIIQQDKLRVSDKRDLPSLINSIQTSVTLAKGNLKNVARVTENSYIPVLGTVD
ncbi:hypothetical protein [Lentilactobacillus kosonis]|uniref:Uncharacterized protein n=1 Tax=Lentilactobacillus kosonis TaxID=2810561 RepID=A0A401FJH8_9LACO|nr:hypothetical protein [Lentilactobacillus kosonis]GAY72446.1 hypothetical protein NBRC111893_592 [Lentilactobacillus kosonis]